MSVRGRPRARGLCAALGLGAAWFAALAAPTALPAQQARAAGAAALVPDTVLVGEPVWLGLSIRAAEEPAFPSVLPLPEELEQLGPPRVRRTADGAWRAVYRLAAWRAGSLALLPVEVPRPGGGPPVRIEPPGVVVTSVLPAEAEELSLRPPRVPELRPGVSWVLVLAALLLAALLAWLLRRIRSARRLPVEGPGPAELDPAEEARQAVAGLRAAAAAGEIGPAKFYDGIEAILRRYLARARGRPPGRPVRGLPESGAGGGETGPADPRLAPLVERALPARFGALSVAGEELTGDADAVLAWLSAQEAA